MRIAIVGGGPGGLYFAILAKRADPSREIVIYERNAPLDTFGFGVVFSAATLGELEDADQASYDQIMAACARWDPVEIRYGDERIRAAGNRFAAISRKTLLNILQRRCHDLGVDVRFTTEVDDPARLAEEADLLLGADGVNSLTRKTFETTFQPRLTPEAGKFIWLGTTMPLDAFTFVFRRNEHGCFQVHAYPYEEHTSTFIVECDERSWRNAGLHEHRDTALEPGQSDHASIAYCAELFADVLGGHTLIANNSKWVDWVTVGNKTWRHENVVLLGDSAHTAHFSIGSGTKLAMEDAIALARALDRRPALDDALADYESERRASVERVQAAAAESLDWFARYHRYLHFEPPQFAYSLLTRSTRVTYENLRTRDPRLVGALERWFAERSGVGAKGVPLIVAPQPAATPFRSGDCEFSNRLVLTAPPETAARDGLCSEDQVHRLAELGRGGAGLLLMELVAVSAQARVTSGCAGLYTDAHEERMARLVEGVHGDVPTRVGVQLVHAGRRGSTRPRRDGTDRALRAGGWPLVAASPIPYTANSPTPSELDRAGMDRIRDDFVAAARRADRAGVDVLELHMGHGYLLASFLSPLSNRREDDYGGTLAGRLRFPLEVLESVRGVWPAGKPLSVCFQASDLQRGGLTEADAVEAARRLVESGADLLNVVAGQTTPHARPDYTTTAFYAPWSDLIRNRVRVPTIVSGAIPTVVEANDVLAAGKADLCILGRPLPEEPDWLARTRGGQGTADR
jgi:anthraniloyl-CoA monooxygenase